MSRRSILFPLMLAIVVASGPSLAGQKKPISPMFDKKTPLTVILPSAAMTVESVAFGGSLILGTTIKKSATGYEPGEHSADWRTAGFPLMTEVRFEKMNTNKERTEIEFRSRAIYFKFRVAPAVDPAAALAEFVLVGGSTDPRAVAYLRDTYEQIGNSVFTGELVAVGKDQRHRLLLLANETASGVGVSRIVYKEKPYFAVELRSDGNVYNTIQLNETQRVARQVNERLLMLLKQFADPLQGAKEVFGVRLAVDISHQDFLNKTVPAETDRVELYAPAELIQKFSDADITNQQFIDGCVVIVDGNRVQVNLSTP